MDEQLALLQSCCTFALPLHDEWLARTSPAELFAAQPDASDVVWVDNAAADSRAGNWSYLALRPRCRIEAHDGRVVLWQGKSRRTIAVTNALAHILAVTTGNRIRHLGSALGPPFRGGWIGYLGYEIGRRTPTKQAVRGLGFPRASLGLFDALLAFSHADRTWWGIAAPLSATSSADCEREARHRMEQLLRQFASLSGCYLPTPRPRQAKTNLSRSSYCGMVRAALGYISAGDIYQVNLAQRLSVPWELRPQDLYLRLRQESPAAYGAYLGHAVAGGSRAVCSISPELFLSLRDGVVVTRPIKGTRPRGCNDDAARRQLAESPKERAELNMIVDLERNDLGRVCEYGSVRVLSPGDIEELPTLFHRVAAVTGKLHHKYNAADLITAAFPGGSVTGAPKIRAMEIIAELEPEPRGPYCGAIGWLGLDGNMELSIAIRTALYDGSRRMAHYHAGSGIVADSNPEMEYEETLHKAAAFLRATNATLAGISEPRA